MEAVWQYSLRQWGFARTQRYIDELDDAFQFLASSPKGGVRCDEIRPGYRRYQVNRHVIYYREAEFGVEIIRILHDRMLAVRQL